MNKEINTLSTIYYRMKRIRLVEEEIANRYREGKMRCPTHLSIGQEAVPSVLGSIIKTEDTAVSTHRCHAHYLAKGGNLRKMIAEIYGKETGCSKGKGGSMHLIDKKCGFMGSSAIVGNSIAIGVGISLTFNIRKKKNISIIYFGEGATEEGIFYESLNFAILRKLNVLFVCENNRYSVYSPMNVRQPDTRSIIDISKGMGIEAAIDIDGNDPEALLQECRPVVENIRNGNGPALIHCSTYRWREHCGPNYDDDLGYRDKAEVAEWRNRDPIPKLKANLAKICEEFRNNLDKNEREIKDEIIEAFDFAEKSKYPKATKAFEDIYAK